MILKHLVLQHFRSYTQSDFAFSSGITYIVGSNTSGKSNILESIYLLSSGKSYRAESDSQMVKFGEEMGRVKALVQEAKSTSTSLSVNSELRAEGNERNRVELEVAIVKETNGNYETEVTPLRSAKQNFEGQAKFKKKYFVNGVARSRLKFAWNLKSLLFVPSDLDIIVGSPSLRRHFFDEVLELVDADYRHAAISYEKAIRQRNALLHTTRETGIRNAEQYAYWNNLVILHGSTITAKRAEFVRYVNTSKRDIADIVILYDKSVISEERLLQYKEAEVASGVTLIGPHRDDFSVTLKDSKGNAAQNVRQFGSRGQQRLVVLQLKILQLEYIEKILGERPLLLLDDIFSELDDSHIHLVMEMVTRQQTIITTTHEEFLSGLKNDSLVIELGK